jgi:hypothetical protein
MLALKMLFNTASPERDYPKSATVQNCFSVSEIVTIYSLRIVCGTVQSASKRRCTVSKFAQRRTSNKRFKFVRYALWDCVPQPLNLHVRPPPEILLRLVLHPQRRVASKCLSLCASSNGVGFMSGNVTNNLPYSPFGLAAPAFSFSVGTTNFVRPSKPNKALKSLISFAGTAYRGPLA